MTTADILTIVPELSLQVDALGWVELLDCMPRLCTPDELATGLDHRLANVARTSTNTAGKTRSADIALVKRLLLDRHTSPFEFAEFTFRIKCPLFVKNQIFRHRTANVNEMSRRYTATTAEEDLFLPSQNAEIYWRTKTTENNRQSSTADAEFAQLQTESLATFEAKMRDLTTYVETVNKQGVANEISRIGLPQATYTTFLFKLDLHNLLHFFGLRCKPDAQYETRKYADAMLKLITPIFPVVIETWQDLTDGVTFTQRETNAIKTKTRLDRASDQLKLENKLLKLGLSFK